MRFDCLTLCGPRSGIGWSLAACVLLVGLAPLRAEEPLHQRIDQLIAAAKPDFEKHAAPLAADAEFLRRIYLDLTGTIPSAVEARAFLADAAAGQTTTADRPAAGQPGTCPPHGKTCST